MTCWRTASLSGAASGCRSRVGGPPMDVGIRPRRLPHRAGRARLCGDPRGSDGSVRNELAQNVSTFGQSEYRSHLAADVYGLAKKERESRATNSLLQDLSFLLLRSRLKLRSASMFPRSLVMNTCMTKFRPPISFHSQLLGRCRWRRAPCYRAG